MLTDKQVLTLTSSAVLLSANACVLSDFEVETIAGVGARFGRFRRDARVSSYEWCVIDQAIEAMRVEQARRTAARTRFLATTRAA